jgi:hypothetical protein
VVEMVVGVLGALVCGLVVLGALVADPSIG